MKQTLPARYTKLINMYKEIDAEGFTLYPMRVSEYEEYLVASRAIGFMSQKLPVELMSLPLLSAFFKLDYKKALAGETPTGLFTSALVSIVLALRLADGKDVMETCKGFGFITSQDDPTVLKAVRFVLNGEEVRTITPVQYQKLRPIIAAQNGIEIPDEDDNPELVEAERDLAEAKAPKLETNVGSLIHTAAALTGKDEEEINGWAILKLHNRLKSYRMILDYLICGIGETQGTTWKSGNPVPHPWFPRIKENSNALIGMESFAGGAGLQAMKDAGAL